MNQGGTGGLASPLLDLLRALSWHRDRVLRLTSLPQVGEPSTTGSSIPVSAHAKGLWLCRPPDSSSTTTCEAWCHWDLQLLLTWLHPHRLFFHRRPKSDIPAAPAIPSASSSLRHIWPSESLPDFGSQIYWDPSTRQQHPTPPSVPTQTLLTGSCRGIPAVPPPALKIPASSSHPAPCSMCCSLPGPASVPPMPDA